MKCKFCSSELINKTEDIKLIRKSFTYGHYCSMYCKSCNYWVLYDKELKHSAQFFIFYGIDEDGKAYYAEQCLDLGEPRLVIYNVDLYYDFSKEWSWTDEQIYISKFELSIELDPRNINRLFSLAKLQMFD